MTTIFAIGFEASILEKTMFYCFNKKIGHFLSEDINKAHEFMSIESAKHDAPKLMEQLFDKPIKYTIFKGTKK